MVTSFLPSELVTEIQALVEPDISEMKRWDITKVNAAKAAGEKM